jgi:hypothetical protein
MPPIREKGVDEIEAPEITGVYYVEVLEQTTNAAHK